MESNISRDHIAMEAMKVIIQASKRDATSFWNRLKRKITGTGNVATDYPSEKKVAKLAYEYADAMIAERDKNKEE
jgi:hypothetical protein